MKINVDENAGFCWGVVQTVEKVENILKENDNINVYILGEIIHNPQEINRLAEKGLTTISTENINELSNDAKVIIRAHGEPPETYQKLESKNISYIDATCPLVQNLQQKVLKYYKLGYQIVIFGKYSHPEIVALRGVCDNECIVIKNNEEADSKINYNIKTAIFSQTTIKENDFKNLIEYLKNKFINVEFIVNNSVCRFVSARENNLKNFAQENEIIIFVAGRNSSNGKSLFNTCNSVNKRTYFIESIDEIDLNWFKGVTKVGITGATSTPLWYLNELKQYLEKIN